VQQTGAASADILKVYSHLPNSAIALHDAGRFLMALVRRFPCENLM